MLVSTFRLVSQYVPRCNISRFILTIFPTDFVADSDAIYDRFEKAGHTKEVREMAVSLLDHMPEEPSARKNRPMKLEYDSVALPSRVCEVKYVSEADYDSVLDFMRGLKDSKIPANLRALVRKTASDWLWYVF